MVTPILIRPCAPNELPSLVGLLDQEFIVSKGRSLSLARRFATALCAGNCPNILLACRGERIAGAIVIRRFDWVTSSHTWRGAMIGLVYARPEERGQGVASGLLRAAETRLRAEGTAFAVLWTTQPEFYLRLGWTGADCGVFGTCVSAGGTAAACMPAEAASIEALRLRSASPHLLRSPAAYRTIPLPAERLELLVSPDGRSYAIFGTQADRAYVYEFGGAPAGYAALWRDIGAAPRTVYINERRGSTAQQWLASRPGISWRDQKLAMWLPLADPDCMRHFSDWYLPYLDRI
jgi:predicted N-acetyltransferase YhbS